MGALQVRLTQWPFCNNNIGLPLGFYSIDSIRLFLSMAVDLGLTSIVASGTEFATEKQVRIGMPHSH